MDTKEFLERLLSTRKEVDNWLSGKAFHFSKYDGELGFLHCDRLCKEGMDGSVCIYSYDKTDARHMVNYADKSCRLNTYGASFINCEQVNDGETWQEILAAHLCEPVRNFGVGGYSVYQSYLRMKREEMQTPAEYIIFENNTDYYRNLLSWQRIRGGKSSKSFHPTLPYVKANPATGEFIECRNPCPTSECLYNLCDLDWVYETFKDDFVLKIMLAYENVKQKCPEESYTDIEKLAASHGIKTKIDNSKTLIETAETIYTRAAKYASMRTIEKVEDFAVANKKKILYFSIYGPSDIEKRIRDGHRFDQEIVEFMQKKQLPYVDMMEAHITDYAQFKTSIGEYLKRYYVGHYNPLGNFFFAFAIKNKLVEIMEQKPIPYRNIPPDEGTCVPLPRDL